MGLKEEICELIYKNSKDTGEGILIDFKMVHSLMEGIESITNKRYIETVKCNKIKDLLNWVKSDLAQEENVKLGKTSTPYRTEKLRFLRKIIEINSL